MRVAPGGDHFDVACGKVAGQGIGMQRRAFSRAAWIRQAGTDILAAPGLNGT